MQRPDTGLNVFEAMLARRSVRSYRDGTLDHKTIGTLLEAAVRAPTAVHAEPWAFVIVQDRQLLHRLSERAKPLFAAEVRRGGIDPSDPACAVVDDPDADIFHNAGTLIVICARPVGPFAVAECWLAAENVMLAACALGLGSCIVGSALPALNTPEIKTELDIPAECLAVAPIIVGYPRGKTPASSRREPVVLAWH